MQRPVLVEGMPDGVGAPGDDLTPPSLLHETTETVLGALLVLFASGDDARGEATGGPAGVDRRAAAEAAICLARAVSALRPDEPEARALLALMLLRYARRDACWGPGGAERTLAEQDRTLWHSDEIAEGRRILEDVLSVGRPGPYLVAAAIAALHDEAPSAADTEWDEILALYDVLAEMAPSPRVALERAVARGMVHGVGVGLVALDELEGTPGLEALLPAARAELLRNAPG